MAYLISQQVGIHVQRHQMFVCFEVIQQSRERIVSNQIEPQVYGLQGTVRFGQDQPNRTSPLVADLVVGEIYHPQRLAVLDNSGDSSCS